MMRALVSRHRGLLPVDTVEGVWRIIVSTFTYVQANYSVHADDSGGDAAMRDSARFHFGFTVPYVTHHGAGAVIEAVAALQGDLGMLRSAGAPGRGRLVDAAHRRASAEDHRASALRRAAQSSGRPAGADRRQAARRGRVAGHCAARRLAAEMAAFRSGRDRRRRPAKFSPAAPQPGGSVAARRGARRGAPRGFRERIGARRREHVLVANVGSHAARFELDTARSGVFAPRS